MTALPLWQQAAIILLCAAATVMTRVLPFLLLRPGKDLPPYVKYLGKALPSAIFALLVVYCMKDISLTSASRGIPEFLAAAVTSALHLWKKQMMLSMAGGTILYMVLIRVIPI